LIDKTLHDAFVGLGELRSLFPELLEKLFFTERYHGLTSLSDAASYQFS